MLRVILSCCLASQTELTGSPSADRVCFGARWVFLLWLAPNHSRTAQHTYFASETKVRNIVNTLLGLHE